jgi:hypothetical protein
VVAGSEVALGPTFSYVHHVLHDALIRECRMRKKRKLLVGWVVYKSDLAGPVGPNAVCEQAEWDAMRLAAPGCHALIRRGIGSEAEAERVARASPGGTTPGRVFLKAHLTPSPTLGR